MGVSRVVRVGVVRAGGGSSRLVGFSLTTFIVIRIGGLGVSNYPVVEIIVILY